MMKPIQDSAITCVVFFLNIFDMSFANDDNHLPPTTPVSESVLSGHEQRLKDIRDALAGRPILAETRSLARSSSQAANKRSLPLPSVDEQGDRHTAMKRARTSRVGDTSVLTLTASKRMLANSTGSRANPAAPTALEAVRPASLFLSREQTHILQLVREGQSVFYTGSAGEFQSNVLDSGLSILHL